MSSKKINEMSTAAGAGAFGHSGKSTFAVNTAAVYDKKNKKKKFKMAKLAETSSERSLREAIRNLIFLNKVKYHEEQAKREIQEQKIRKVIRFLLKEADNTRDINFTTTGAASAWTFITQIEKTTFENDFANTLRTSKEQRDSFKTVYLTGLKVYLDALDQQYLILNPEDQPGGQAPPMGQQPQSNDQVMPDMGAGPPPAKRGDEENLEEVDQEPEVHPAAAQALPAPNEPLDTSTIQSAAVQSAIQTTSQQNLDKTGRNAAESALKRDLPQIDSLYFNLTFKQVTLQSGRNTNDRQEFRFFLIGDQSKAGNIQIKFKEWEDKTPLGTQQGASDTPKMEPNPLNLPDISGSPAPTAPVGGLPTPPAAGNPALASNPLTPDEEDQQASSELERRLINKRAKR